MSAAAFRPNLVKGDRIVIAREARHQPLLAFPISNRLAHIFEAQGFTKLGDLHGLPFQRFLAMGNCGPTTLQELKNFVRSIQRPRSCAPKELRIATTIIPAQCHAFFVTPEARNLNPYELPLSVRLESVLQSLSVKRLSDLHALPVRTLTSMGNCGKITVHELFQLLQRVAAGEFQVARKAFSPSDVSGLPALLEVLLSKLPPRNRTILLQRLGAKANHARTLEEVGDRFHLTRERTRQIISETLLQLRRAGGPQFLVLLKGLSATCEKILCPLTPPLLAHWLGENIAPLPFPLGFYIRLLGELEPRIPVWPRGQEPQFMEMGQTRVIANALKAVLLKESRPIIPIRPAFQGLTAQSQFSRLAPWDFLMALKHSSKIIVQFPRPGKPELSLRSIPLAEIAKPILQASPIPLTPEQILARAQPHLAARLTPRKLWALRQAMTPQKGYYLLDENTFGLRRHFETSKPLWPKAWADFARLLEQEHRPISTNKVINTRRFPWTQQANPHLLASILRENKKFTDLGRFLFALASWGTKTRPKIKELMTKVLAQAGQPLTSSQILERLQQFRSVERSSISVVIRNHDQIRSYGFGRYGLRSWGESAKQFLLSDPVIVERAIRSCGYAPTFAQLCQVLEIPVTGSLADQLWKTSAALPTVTLHPLQPGPVTLLVHKACSLERALVAIARALNRPLVPSQFKAELETRFSPRFANASLLHLRQCLHRSPLFQKTADDAFCLTHTT